jgi:hypothetical protein
MGKNKQQAAAEARSKKATSEVEPQPVAAVGPNPGQINGDTGKVNEQPKPNGKASPATVAAATQPAVVSKQTQTIETLKAGWVAKGVDLSKLTVKDDGKFKLLIVDEGWPTVRLGSTGGITVMELRSYASAFDAAMNGLELYQKQQAREQKKTVAAAPSQPAPKAAAPEAAKAPAAEKQSASA